MKAGYPPSCLTKRQRLPALTRSPAVAARPPHGCRSAAGLPRSPTRGVAPLTLPRRRKRLPRGAPNPHRGGCRRSPRGGPRRRRGRRRSEPAPVAAPPSRLTEPAGGGGSSPRREARQPPARRRRGESQAGRRVAADRPDAGAAVQGAPQLQRARRSWRRRLSRATCSRCDSRAAATNVCAWRRTVARGVGVGGSLSALDFR